MPNKAPEPTPRPVTIVFSVSSTTQPDVSSQKNGVRKTSDRAFVETAALLPPPQRVSQPRR